MYTFQSMDNSLDLLIQDFVTTNKLVNHNIQWGFMVSRRFENGRRRIFDYNRGVAIGEHVDMGDAEWFVIELTAPNVPVESLRFDCLKLMYGPTHYTMSVNKEESTIVIRLLTKNQGLMNVMFKVRLNANPITSGSE